jgi:glycerol-3-phosphate dehydrogenase (NAD+)
MMNLKEKVCIIGSGNWGSAIAKIVGENTERHSDVFEKEVTMWVYEELVQGEKLTEIINRQHENVKYLPGIRLPDHIVAIPELTRAAAGASLLIFVVPHQFVKGLCDQLRPMIESLQQRTIPIRAISLIKGMSENARGISLISDVIRQTLNIDVSVLSGANIANEVAAEQFCETTIGYRVLDHGMLFQKLFHTHYFNVSIIEDTTGVELCGALKNVVAIAAGFSDGLEYGSNTKAAILRIGLMEMMRLCRLFDPHVKWETFLESCGIADIITTCYAGRNRKCAEAYARTGKPFDVLEKELLNGQKLQGVLTAHEVYGFLESHHAVEQFPLFRNVYRICYEGVKPQELLKGL